MPTPPQFLRPGSLDFDGQGLKFLLWVLLGGQIALAAQVAGPLRASGDPRYFKDAHGTVLILNGSQTWNTLQDWGSNGRVQTLDFNAYVNFSQRTDTILLCCGAPNCRNSAASDHRHSPPDLTVSPLPWLRTGPGKATDGGLKFDLTKFDQAFSIACGPGRRL